MTPSAGGTEARDVLLGVLRGIIRNLMQRKVLLSLAHWMLGLSCDVVVPVWLTAWLRALPDWGQ